MDFNYLLVHSKLIRAADYSERSAGWLQSRGLEVEISNSQDLAIAPFIPLVMVHVNNIFVPTFHNVGVQID